MTSQEKETKACPCMRAQMLMIVQQQEREHCASPATQMLRLEIDVLSLIYGALSDDDHKENQYFVFLIFVNR